MILAGGFATRLRPLSCTRPKILFPIVNKPLLEWTLERLAKNNIKEAIMAVNYQTEIAIKQRKIQKYGVNLSYSRDPIRKPLGTGGPIKKAEKQIGHDSPFLVLNGDVFADVNYTELLKLHEKKGAIATIALHKVEDPSRYGVAELAEDNRIKRFIEKPSPKEAPTNLINAGVYAFSPEIFECIPEKRAVSIEREVFPKLAEKGMFYGYIHKGLWMDIGKPEDYLEINKILLDSFFTLQKLKVKSGVEIKTPVFFDKVSLGEKSVIGPYAVLGKNVTVGGNVCIQNSVILPNTIISNYATIKEAIVGEGVYIGKRAKISEGCIIGDHTKIGDNVSLAKGVLICPAKEVYENIQENRCII
ncbi:MAG: NDP-sugar synthase [Candidatus Bathyarchaeota archaeon]|nr:NDP-sugar synthase [Candidatus Bathyarchaeota archaeon]